MERFYEHWRDEDMFDVEEENRIIFTNGCFDLLHMGHIKFLEACKAIGGHLVVGLNSDTSVKRLKGEHRPIIPELERKYALLALECVDEVVIFVEDRPLELINLMQPDIYVKSDEYMNAKLPEFEAVREYGGRVAIVQPDPYLREIHTSAIVDRIFDSEMKRRLEQ